LLIPRFEGAKPLKAMRRDTQTNYREEVLPMKFQSGQSGDPAGRPPGARNNLYFSVNSDDASRETPLYINPG
jgi:hypothetical protein